MCCFCFTSYCIYFNVIVPTLLLLLLLLCSSFVKLTHLSIDSNSSTGSSISISDLDRVVIWKLYIYLFRCLNFKRNLFSRHVGCWLQPLIFVRNVNWDHDNDRRPNPKTKFVICIFRCAQNTIFSLSSFWFYTHVLFVRSFLYKS